ncbi:helix-turn-helix transcriptional regulator [Pseudonocardia parietis]|uniref:Site-specific integrase-resolvase n=1 Tax=Pseudonocardia parietis TaxID=570936 RepID=A0ABS4VMA0_9PSEU|nr:putative site-specific integrase-resolvase [Pseudonocardia parietis]
MSDRALARPLNLREAAEMIGVPESTLRYWRATGRDGPVGYRVGRRVMYDEAEVQAYRDACRAAAKPQGESA